MSRELLPCPFCDKPPRYLESNPGFYSERVICDSCHFHLPPAAWNRRTALASPEQQGVTDDCKGLSTALLQARYALNDYDRKQPNCGFSKLAEACRVAADMITSQAQPASEDKPVSYQFQDRGGKWCNFLDDKHYRDTADSMAWHIRALYTRPVPTDQDALHAKLYRHLRAQHWSESDLCVVVDPKRAVKLGYECPSEDRLDALLIAAIERAGEKK